MVIVIRKKIIKRYILIFITLAIVTLAFTQNVENTTVEVYSLTGSPDEERDYWNGTDDIYWDIRDTGNPAIAITFDDGPHPVYTPRILNVLDKYDVKATFFVIGKYAKEYPEVIKMMSDKGHEIANHTYTHPRMKSISLKDLEDEINKTHQLIRDITGNEPALFRPPGGYYNKKIVAKVKQINYKIILWSFTQDTRDWANPGVEKIVRNVLRNADSGDIIIFHDSGSDRSQTIKALDIILEDLIARGFDIVTVSELLERRK